MRSFFHSPSSNSYFRFTVVVLSTYHWTTVRVTVCAATISIRLVLEAAGIRLLQRMTFCATVATTAENCINSLHLKNGSRIQFKYQICEPSTHCFERECSMKTVALAKLITGRKLNGMHSTRFMEILAWETKATLKIPHQQNRLWTFESHSWKWGRHSMLQTLTSIIRQQRLAIAQLHQASVATSNERHHLLTCKMCAIFCRLVLVQWPKRLTL